MVSSAKRSEVIEYSSFLPWRDRDSFWNRQYTVNTRPMTKSIRSVAIPPMAVIAPERIALILLPKIETARWTISDQLKFSKSVILVKSISFS